MPKLVTAQIGHTEKLQNQEHNHPGQSVSGPALYRVVGVADVSPPDESATGLPSRGLNCNGFDTLHVQVYASGNITITPWVFAPKQNTYITMLEYESGFDGTDNFEFSIEVDSRIIWLEANAPCEIHTYAKRVNSTLN